MINLHLGNIGQTIQLAIAPVFLLTGVGTNLTVLTNRLARIIDRSRTLEEMVSSKGLEGMPELNRIELDELYQRTHLINRAITLSSTCALFVCLIIGALFLGDAFNVHLDKLIAAFFVSAVMALIGSFIYFLREIFVATKTLTRQRENGAKYLPK
jgi:hypothetical protein